MNARSSDFRTLGLMPGASWDEVKAAFRRLARTHHPDVAGPGSARRFAEITEAYMTLKETISPGSPGFSHAHVSAAYAEPPANVRAEPAGREPFLKTLWRKLFSRKPNTEAEDASPPVQEDMPPVRVRFIGSTISKAEAQMRQLLSRRSEMKTRSRTAAILCRLQSRHPGVVMLALKRLTPNEVNHEIRKSMVEHFAKYIPTSEVLESVLALFSRIGECQDLARAIAPHAGVFSQADALMVIKWLKRHNAPRECFCHFFAHSSNSVIAAVLNGWSSQHALPETSVVLSLLKQDDESLLVPLLHLLKRNKPPYWAAPYIAKISAEHKSPVVRVWASAIVRDQNLS